MNGEVKTELRTQQNKDVQIVNKDFATTQLIKKPWELGSLLDDPIF